MNKKNSEYYDYALFIGRFQPFHNGHRESIHFALSNAKNLLIVIGGYQLAPSPTDPWTAEERKTMILAALSPSERKRVQFIFVRDRLYNEALWKENVESSVQLATKPKSKIAIFGHSKDESSYYLKIFPKWTFVETGNFLGINGTDIRHNYFSNSKATSNAALSRSLLPNAVARTLRTFKEGKLFKLLKQEYAYAQQPKNKESSLLLKPQFVLIMVGSYVLIEKHTEIPGKNLYALPTLHINFLPKNYDQYCLKRHTFHYQKYDCHGKDVVFYKIPRSVEFNMNSYVNSKNQSWILLDDLCLIENKMFEDHYQILKTLI